jgi:hypothetical protein
MYFMRSGVVIFFSGRYFVQYRKRFFLTLPTILLSLAVKIYSLMTFVSMDSTGLTNWVRRNKESKFHII